MNAPLGSDTALLSTYQDSDSMRQELIAGVSTGKLRKTIEYTDSGSGSDNLNYAYNAQGELIYVEDQSGNVIEHVFDTDGMVTER